MTAPTRRCVVCHVAYPGGERFCSIDGGAIVEDAPAGTVSRIGQTIDGRYLVRSLLGRGGMGEVYAADHVGLDKRVAIKFVTSDNTQKTALARFRREARVASRIVHEHVVHIYDVGADHGVDFIVMEFLEGQDLRQLLAAEGKLEPARAVAITRQMLAGLHAIHQAGILHRDIKPANVLLTTRGRDRDFVKIMDFGISKSIESDDAAASLTGTGNVIGTPQFIAPEMLRGAVVDHRADLYAVGITLYAMLTGDGPFKNTAFERMVAMHLTETPRALDEIRRDVSPNLAAAVARSLAKDPDERFADAQEFADALEPDDVPAPRIRARTEPPIAVAKPGDANPTVASPRRAPALIVTEDLDAPTPTRRTGRWVLAFVLVILAGLAVGMVIRASRTAAVTADAASDGGSLVDETLALASRCEAEGKTQLAIDLYEEAFNSVPDPELVFKVAELYEHLAKHAEAAEAYQRYLEIPEGKQHELARERRVVVVAQLPAPVVDAGIDAPLDAEPPDAVGAATPTPTPTAAPMTCVCVPDKAKDTAPLCFQRGASRCKCVTTLADLCPAAPVGCGPTDAGCEPSSFKCPVVGWRGYGAAGKQGAACAGFKVGPAAAREVGTTDCRVCEGENPRQFRGQPGDGCLGYFRETGEELPGHLENCRPDL